MTTQLVEFRVVEAAYNLQEQLNNIAFEGWRLHSVLGKVLVFERPHLDGA